MKKIYRYPIAILLVIGAITFFFASRLPQVELDNNNFRFISPDDPARRVSEYIDDTFGSSLFILVGLRRHYGDVFEASFLETIREYVDRVEQIEIIDPVSSIVNADYITGSADAITVEKLLPDDFSGTKEEIAALKERILSWDMYRRSLISDDFTATQILVPMNISNEDAGKPEVVDSFIQVRDIAREMFDGRAEVYVTGIPVISATINEAVRSDLRLLVPLVILVVLVVLFFSFRRLSAVILPLLTVLIAAVWSVGAMPFFDIKLSVISTVLPVILVAVGSAYGIHVITHYREDFAASSGVTGRELSREDHFELVCATVNKIRKPVFLAALTTFAGFSSFCFTTVLPIREFGFFASFGVLASFAVAMTMIPALVILRGPERKSFGEKSGAEEVPFGREEGLFARSAGRFFTVIAMRKGLVLFCSSVLILVSVLGASRLIIDNVFIEYFKNDTDISKSDRFIREKFGGSKIVSVVAEADSSEILLGPESLGAMDSLAAYLEREVPEVGRVVGFTDLVKRINQVFNVDESPSGLRPTEDPGGTAFGFGDDSAFSNEPAFGFDGEPAFGFGADTFVFGGGPAPGPSAADSANAAANATVDTPANAGFPGEKAWTIAELTELLSRASRSGRNREIDAGEFVWELKKLVNYEGASYYEIPSDPARYGKTRPEELSALVSNYLILLSGDIDSYANDPLEPTAIKSTVQLRTLGEADTGRALEEIRNFVTANFPASINVTIGGSAMVESSLNRQVVQSQIISVIISLVLVFIIIAVSNRSVAGGLVGIVPLSISILINFAVMGFLGIKLNIGTSMIASLAVGIGIDYTIHYMEAFKREVAELGITDLALLNKNPKDKRNFLGRSFAVSGKAIIINAVSVGAGFAVLIFSRFNMLGDFGLLIALTMGTSALVSLTVIPALLLAIKPGFVYKNRSVI
ncbi:MAG: MMPL family transporter [Treponema sp.]|jgi:predicted RND superfamily exporter protein|nr:MMPL family transporter [Treponema sp.]